MATVQAVMQEVLERSVAEGRERGVQLTAYRHGELVVDAWAGVTDAATARPVDGETLFPVFSSSKGIAATLLHLQMTRRQLSYDMPVATVWPEFAAQGKAATTVRHLLNHTAGLALMPMGIGYAELGDWATMCALLAESTPITPAGTVTCYHAVTFGFLVGEVARRIDGRPFQQMLHEEIAAPLGLADSLFIGIPDAVEPRVAILDEEFAPGMPEFPDDSVPQAIPSWLLPLHAMLNRPDGRRACVPASTGIMTARALARHYAALLPGGVDGVELLPAECVRQATQPQRPAGDPAAETTPCFGLGYILSGDPTTPAFGHDGYGGSSGFADPALGLAVGLTKNYFSPNGAGTDILQALREAIAMEEDSHADAMTL